jgi:hypothetical protein
MTEETNPQETEQTPVDLNSESIQKAISAAVESATSGLKSKNDELLGKLSKSNDKLRAFGDLDPEGIKTMMANFNQSEDAKLLSEGKFDELMEKKTDRIKAEYNDQINELSQKFEKTSESAAFYKQALEKKTIDDAVRNAALKENVLPQALDDVLRRAGDVFSINQDGELEARDSSGQLRKTEDGMLLKPENFVESLKKEAPHYWPQSVGVGASGNNGKGYTDQDMALKLNELAKSGDQVAYRELRKKMKQ